MADFDAFIPQPQRKRHKKLASGSLLGSKGAASASPNKTDGAFSGCLPKATVPSSEHSPSGAVKPPLFSSHEKGKAVDLGEGESTLHLLRSSKRGLPPIVEIPQGGLEEIAVVPFASVPESTAGARLKNLPPGWTVKKSSSVAEDGIAHQLTAMVNSCCPPSEGSLEPYTNRGLCDLIYGENFQALHNIRLALAELRRRSHCRQKRIADLDAQRQKISEQVLEDLKKIEEIEAQTLGYNKYIIEYESYAARKRSSLNEVLERLKKARALSASEVKAQEDDLAELNARKDEKKRLEVEIENLRSHVIEKYKKGPALTVAMKKKYPLGLLPLMQRFYEELQDRLPSVEPRSFIFLKRFFDVIDAPVEGSEGSSEDDVPKVPPPS